MLIYHLQLPAHQDPKAFVKFMQAEYFPAIYKGLSRIGQVKGLVLLQGNTTSITHEFFWHVEGQMVGDPRVENEAVQRKFESFNAQLELVGNYVQAVTWRSGAQA